MENSSLLLVEGKSEVHVIKELCKLCNINTTFKTEPKDSLSELKTALKTELKSTNIYRKIWVIIDADVNFDGAWQSIRDILIKSRKYDINHKLQLPDNGIIIQPKDHNDITVGIWIMPNNSDVGMLEDFLISLIPDDNKLIKKSKNIISEIDKERDLHDNVFKKVHESKATVHTWLAWHDTPGESLGVAINKKLFQTNADLCVKFNDWLTKLND